MYLLLCVSEISSEMKKIKELDQKVDDLLRRIQCLTNVSVAEIELKDQLQTYVQRKKKDRLRKRKDIVIAQ